MAVVQCDKYRCRVFTEHGRALHRHAGALLQALVSGKQETFEHAFATCFAFVHAEQRNQCSDYTVGQMGCQVPRKQITLAATQSYLFTITTDCSSKHLNNTSIKQQYVFATHTFMV